MKVPCCPKETDMKKSIATLFFTLFLAMAGMNCLAGANDPLFVNMTTDDGHRASMALSFGKNQLERGHPLTVFLNDKGVYVGSRLQAHRFPEQQKQLAELMTKGASVIACPMCMKHYGVQQADLLPGIQVGNPELTGSALFRDNTRTLTW
jgi:sulfur relay (sulfurtransferase) complex TusBCD TusD component (DsrE family)